MPRPLIASEGFTPDVPVVSLYFALVASFTTAATFTWNLNHSQASFEIGHSWQNLWAVLRLLFLYWERKCFANAILKHCSQCSWRLFVYWELALVWSPLTVGMKFPDRTYLFRKRWSSPGEWDCHAFCRPNLIFCDCQCLIPRSGELQAQKFKSHLLRIQSLKFLRLKPGVGQFIAIHAALTTRDFFLANFYPSSPFICIFFKTTPESFLCWLWLTLVPVWACRIK